MKTLIFTDHEKQMIEKHECVCYASAEDIIKRSGCSFEDIEAINQHSEKHKQGSNAERKYRKAAINKAIQKVASSPRQYLNN